MRWETCDCPNCTKVPMYWHERYGQVCPACYEMPRLDLAKVDESCQCSGCKALRRLRDGQVSGDNRPHRAI
jgi:hypothetical protein